MALSRPRAGATALCVVLLLGLAGCGTPVSPDDAGATTSASPSPSPDRSDDGTGADGEDDGGTDSDGGGSDGGEDPAQDRVRTGPVAQYGGPAYGDQGVAEVIAAGVWCKTIAVFWGGGEPIPEGVRFTFDGAATDRPGLQVEGEACGSRGADRSCLGLTVAANESGIFCGLLLRPSADFQDGTLISFVGTLECPSAEICDAVAARAVDPGPPIVVTDPEADGGDAPIDGEEESDEQAPGEQQPSEDPDQPPADEPPGEEP